MYYLIPIYTPKFTLKPYLSVSKYITLNMFKRKLFFALFLGSSFFAKAQFTSFVNGVADVRSGTFAFTNANIVKDANTTLQNATMVIKQGKIIAIGAAIAVPADAVTINCSGKFIYPSFIDIYAEYGVAVPARTNERDYYSPVQFNSNSKGAFAWNQALKPEVNAANIFVSDDAKAKSLRDIGFGAVLSHSKDGIARGTGCFVDLSGRKENQSMLKDKAAAFYSFSKGASTQAYPSSLMGSIALLRQTFLDATWYANNGRTQEEGLNLSLQALNDAKKLPQIFEANSKWNGVRADRIGDEAGFQFVIKAGQDEYQRINEVKATKASYILPLNFPQAMDVEDPMETRFISLQDLKHWEMAASNPAAFEKAGINFCFTTADLKDTKQFLANVKKAMQYGLSEKAALNALTKNAAEIIGVFNMVGSLEAGKYANFFVATGNIFAEKTSILQNWVQGEKFVVKADEGFDSKGKYAVKIMQNNQVKNFMVDVKDNGSAEIIAADTIKAKYSNDGKSVKLAFTEAKKLTKGFRLSGTNNGTTWNGTGVDSLGNNILWSASYVSTLATKQDSAKKPATVTMGVLTYPLGAYGVAELPSAKTYLYKNATVWTNEKEGVLKNTDVLVSGGKIVKVGKDIVNPTAIVVDATGKHITAGIIDEHSHIATESVNEGAQSITSEVRIGDNLDPEDIDIYRQLAGGVTTSHILHGSANAIGGQTQLIKLRWGVSDSALKFAGADGFIKFALGENVKRNPAPINNRYPNTRMGVEQVQIDGFTRAKDYMNALKGPNASKVRRDLELDCLVEIMQAKRFITCHSYVASEILQTMEMAEKFGFKINTFTHILEGYKVADKMKAHGAAASTFSDWWAYKLEVQDAIPQNPAIMHNAGLNVAINSDDAEMARRLNQEAAKSVLYAGMSEEDALKMVTLNPAKMLHVDDKVGSIKVGKDADIVIWSDNPLSVYAKAEQTLVDGIVYYDKQKDAQMRSQIATERTRLINKMIEEKAGGASTMPAKPSLRKHRSCGFGHASHSVLDVDDDGEN
jgi:imidazolonepropionase-like amidohydrolase